MSLDALQPLIRGHVAELGFELVDLKRAGTVERPILQVRVDREDSRPGAGITADDCALISRSLERLLESRALVGPRYVLEVSSPGLERPIRWPEHWRRFVGRQVRLRAPGLPGLATVTIVGMPDAAHVTVRADSGEEITLALDQIRDAVLAVDWSAVAGTARPKGHGRRR
ncbi:MAG: ribosome maturation factor RimP [Gemmatimonadales bacterium]|nr:ribosome maturation factor RimP [Gemmatimonadales bacterium]